MPVYEVEREDHQDRDQRVPEGQQRIAHRTYDVVGAVDVHKGERGQSEQPQALYDHAHYALHLESALGVEGQERHDVPEGGAGREEREQGYETDGDTCAEPLDYTDPAAVVTVHQIQYQEEDHQEYRVYLDQGAGHGQPVRGIPVTPLEVVDGHHGKHHRYGVELDDQLLVVQQHQRDEDEGDDRPVHPHPLADPQNIEQTDQGDQRDHDAEYLRIDVEFGCEHGRNQEEQERERWELEHEIPIRHHPVLDHLGLLVEVQHIVLRRICVQNIIQRNEEHDRGHREKDGTTVFAVERLSFFVGDPAHHFFHIIMIYIDSPERLRTLRYPRNTVDEHSIYRMLLT